MNGEPLPRRRVPEKQAQAIICLYSISIGIGHKLFEINPKYP